MDDSSADLTSRELATWLALVETVDTVRDHLAEQLADAADLSLVQFDILNRLDAAADGALRMTDIADGMVASRSSITYQVKRLMERELVERRGSAVDERVVEVALTAQGRRQLEHLLPAHSRLLKHLMFVTISGRRLDELASTVDDLRNHLRTAPPRSVRRRAGRALRLDGS